MRKRKRNPVRIGERIRIDFRSANNRFSSIEKAKYFYIYIDGELVLMDEFSRIRLPKSEKESIVREYVHAAIDMMAETFLPPEDELDEQIDLAEEMFKDLLFIISQEDPEFFEEEFIEIPEEEDEEEFEEEIDEFVEDELDRELDLSEQLYQDLLDVIADEDPDLFTEITRPPFERPPGYVEEELKEIYSVNLSQEALVFHDRYFFDEGQMVNAEDIHEVLKFFDEVYAPILREMFVNRPPGKDNLVIPALLMRMQTSARRHKIQGISVPRAEATNLWEFEKLVIEDLRDQVFQSYPGYLKQAFDGKLMQIGVALETMNLL